MKRKELEVIIIRFMLGFGAYRAYNISPGVIEPLDTGTWNSDVARIFRSSDDSSFYVTVYEAQYFSTPVLNV